MYLKFHSKEMFLCMSFCEWRITPFTLSELNRFELKYIRIYVDIYFNIFSIYMYINNRKIPPQHWVFVVKYLELYLIYKYIHPWPLLSATGEIFELKKLNPDSFTKEKLWNSFMYMPRYFAYLRDKSLPYRSHTCPCHSYHSC